MNPTGVPLPAPNDSFILVVDDVPHNIQVVGSILRDAGYEVMPATSGPQALERIRSKVPDLMLLDLMMPGMDGLEVCRRVKALSATDIPIILLTASNETEHLVQAFAAGAVDYVTKPFRAVELLARVRVHLELKQSRDTLHRQSQELHDLNEEKNEVLSIVAHDLRSPLHNILVSAELLGEDPNLQRPPAAEMLGFIHQAADHMLQLVRQLLDVDALEQGRLQMQPGACSLAELVASAVDSHRIEAQAKQQALQFIRPTEPVVALVDPNATLQVVDNLISNAIKYSPPGKDIRVRVTPRQGAVRLEVQDEGPGLTPADHQRLFGKFARLSAKPTGGETSTGLGLSIVKRMAEASQGRVWCESQAGQGATFIVEWPAAAVG